MPLNHERTTGLRREGHDRQKHTTTAQGNCMLHCKLDGFYRHALQFVRLLT